MGREDDGPDSGKSVCKQTYAETDKIPLEVQRAAICTLRLYLLSIAAMLKWLVHQAWQLCHRLWKYDFQVLIWPISQLCLLRVACAVLMVDGL